jgi:murein tripeptide amidase MpaA
MRLLISSTQSIVFTPHHLALLTMNVILHNSFLYRSITWVVVVVSLFFCVVSTSIFAQISVKARSDDDRFVKARVYFSPQFGVEEAEEIGVEVEHGILKGKEYIENVISLTTLKALQQRGVRVSILEEDAEKSARERIESYFRTHLSKTSHETTSETPHNFKLGTMGGFFRLNEIYAEFARMRELFPNLVSQAETIGMSVEGAPIQAYRICAQEATATQKPEVLYTALHHAREPGGASSLIYFLWSLLENSQDNKPEARYLLNNRQLYVVPMVNPDGYLWNQTTNPAGGGMWRKNRRQNQDGSFGVDLNRNYGTATFWNAPNNGSSTNPRSDTYRGTEPFSEPETQALRDFCTRRNFRTAINFHTFSNLLIYPYSYIDRESPDSTYFRALTAEITKNNLYSAGRDMQTVGYAVRGSSDDWMYAGMSGKNIMAYTPEVGTPDDGFWPTPDRIIPHGAENLATNMMTAWSAGVNLRPVQSYVREHPTTGAARLVVEVQNIGIQHAQEMAGLSIRALVRGVTFVRADRSIRALRSTELTREVFDILVDSTIKNGTVIPTEIIISQENTPRRDTVSVQVREARRITVFETAADAQNWQLGRWNVVQDALAGKSALTDSPQGLYRASDNNFCRMARPISLAGIRAATLEFQTRWSVESNGDLAVVQVSDDNGQSWRFLRTSLMKSGRYAPGIGDEGFGYDGNFPQWIRQEYPLDAWLGKNILVRFGMISDASAQFDGFYVSNVALRLYADTLSQRVIIPSAANPRVLPNVIVQGADIRVEVPISSIDAPLSLSIVNVIGQRVFAEENAKVQVDGSVLIPSASFARGLYFVEVRSGSTITREKLLIQ